MTGLSQTREWIGDQAVLKSDEVEQVRLVGNCYKDVMQRSNIVHHDAVARLGIAGRNARTPSMFTGPASMQTPPQVLQGAPGS
jgi:hypothetical protein